MRVRTATLLTLLLGAVISQRVVAAVPADLVRAELLADVSTISPGQTFTAGVRLTIKDGWHIYWINPGDSGLPTRVNFNVPDGFEVGPLLWPLPERFDQFGLAGYGYEKQVMLMARITAPRDLKPGAPITISADAKWLCCETTCVPGEATVSLKLSVAEESKPANASTFDQWRQLLPLDAGDVLADLTTSSSDDAKKSPWRLTLRWKQPVNDVQWFPATDGSMELADATIDHAADRTTIAFTPRVYEADAFGDTLVKTLVTYRDAQGVRRGAWVPVDVRASLKN